MFNDRYGLTQAVIEGRKTMAMMLINIKSTSDVQVRIFAGLRPKSSGVVAMYVLRKSCPTRSARSWPWRRDIKDTFDYSNCVNPYAWEDDDKPSGWTNKMLTKAELMPHQIRITGIKCERLQDISDAECMKEGVVGGIIGYYVPGIKCKDWSKESYVDTEDGRTWKLFPTPREAFASLIDKVSGRGTWQRNPWVVAYEFELVK